MPITSYNDYLNAGKQRLQIVKTQTRTSVAVNPFTVFDLGGHPGAGTLAGSSSDNGVKPDDTTAGFPAINFSSGETYRQRSSTILPCFADWFFTTCFLRRVLTHTIQEPQTFHLSLLFPAAARIIPEDQLWKRL